MYKLSQTKSKCVYTGSIVTLMKQCWGSSSLRYHYTLRLIVIHFAFLMSLCFPVVCSSSWLWGLCVGGESKANRMDWYSSQTTGLLLLEALFKPNVNGFLKPVCSSLLNKKPTSVCAGRASEPLAGLGVKQGYTVLRCSSEKSCLLMIQGCFIKNVIKFDRRKFSDVEKSNREINTQRIKPIREGVQTTTATGDDRCQSTVWNWILVWEEPPVKQRTGVLISNICAKIPNREKTTSCCEIVKILRAQEIITLKYVWSPGSLECNRYISEFKSSVRIKVYISPLSVDTE